LKPHPSNSHPSTAPGLRIAAFHPSRLAFCFIPNHVFVMPSTLKLGDITPHSFDFDIMIAPSPIKFTREEHGLPLVKLFSTAESFKLFWKQRAGSVAVVVPENLTLKLP